MKTCNCITEIYINVREVANVARKATTSPIFTAVFSGNRHQTLVARIAAVKTMGVVNLLKKCVPRTLNDADGYESQEEAHLNS